ncbi:MAG TPA: hypothetical protein VM221_03760 [Armatimonadota bacterium]|nr:hypothetical protein [Armatimonadota bacterium]
MTVRWAAAAIMLALSAEGALAEGAPGPGAAPVAIAVSPPIVRLRTGAGGSARFKITVSNVGRQQVHIEAVTRDITLTPDGMPLVGARGEDRWSCAGWIEVRPERMELRPQASQEVVCTLKVPRGVTGGRYASVLFQAQHLRPPTGVGLRVEARLGALVMQTVPLTGRPAAEVALMQATPHDGGVEVVVEVRNTGNIDFKATGSAVVYDAGGRVAGRIGLNGGTGTVLPDGVRRLTGTWTPRRLAAGDYVVEARIAIPGRGTLRGRTSVVVSASQIKTR